MAKDVGDNNGSELCRLAEAEFAKKIPFDQLNQFIAEQTYPQKANFISDRTLSEEFAQEMIESTPAQNHREFSNAMDQMLRPNGEHWFGIEPEDEERKTDRAVAYNAGQSKVLYNSIYRPLAGYQDSMGERDRDIAAFGNAVTGVMENKDRNGLLFRPYHLKDCSWTENSERVVDVLYRQLQGFTLRHKVEKWGMASLTESEKNIIEKNPEEESEILHVALPKIGYEPYSKVLKRHDYVSVYICKRSRKVLEEKGRVVFPYAVARSELRTGSQYGYSAAGMLGLVESRLLQAQATTILQAGELQANPPFATFEDAADYENLGPGGVVVIDSDYKDARNGGFWPMEMGKNMNISLEMKQDTREILSRLWGLNRLFLPDANNGDMTALEVSERTKEWLNSVGPIMRPWIKDNTLVLDIAFSVLMAGGAFGFADPETGMLPGQPEELAHADLTFSFNTPLQIAYERMEAMEAQEVLTKTMEAAQADPSLADHVDRDAAFRAGISGIGGSRFLKPMEVVGEERAARDQQLAQMQKLEEAKQMTDMAPKAAGAIKSVSDAAGNMDEQGAAEIAALMEQLGGDDQAKQAGAEVAGEMVEEIAE